MEAAQISVGLAVRFVDGGTGLPTTGRVVELWSEQDIAVVQTEDDVFMSQHFLPYDKIAPIA